MNKMFVCTRAPGPFRDATGTAGCLDPPVSALAPKRLLRSPLVTITGGSTALITFNAALARQLGIARFKYVAVRYDPRRQTVRFVLSNDELAYGGSYTLSFNGGTGKKKGSPSRAFYVPRGRMPFLTNGAYRAEARETGSELVVTIRLDQPVAQR